IGTGARLRPGWRKPWRFESSRPQAKPEKGFAPSGSVLRSSVWYGRVSPLSARRVAARNYVAAARRYSNFAARDKSREILQPHPRWPRNSASQAKARERQLRQVQQFDRGQAMRLTATVSVKPEISLKEYKDIRVPRPRTEIRDVDVDEAIERLRGRFAELHAVERPVQAGDFLTVDTHILKSGA